VHSSNRSIRLRPVDGEADDNSADAFWYVVHTRARAEARALQHLETQGFYAFCPRYRRTVRHARKAKSVLAPLFPSYLFVCLDVSRDQWRSVNGTRGVVNILMQDGKPQSIPAGVIDSLRARMRADGTMDWRESLKVGGPVRITDGPFAELLGTLEYCDAAGRVRVLLSLLGRSVSVAMSGEALLPAV
jgi:transcription elongation factor/antiterminator RfaH